MRRRRVGFILICSAMVPLAVASAAWACGVLATLKLDTKAAAPGATVGVTGKNYSANTASATPVTIRLDNRSGPVLKDNVPVQANGTISTSVQLPANVNPGWYVVLATQNLKDANGNPTVPKSGTPGRTSLRVGSAKRKSGAAAPWSSSKPAGPGASGASVEVDGGGVGSPAPLPTLLAIVLSLGLLGTGVTLVGRGRARAANRPVLGA